MYGQLSSSGLIVWHLLKAVIDAELVDGQLHLLRLCPLGWLSADEQTVFDQVPTEHGVVDLRFRLADGGARLDVEFEGRWHGAAPDVLLHLPPVDGLRTVRSTAATTTPAIRRSRSKSPPQGEDSHASSYSTHAYRRRCRLAAGPAVGRRVDLGGRHHRRHGRRSRGPHRGRQTGPLRALRHGPDPLVGGRRHGRRHRLGRCEQPRRGRRQRRRAARPVRPDRRLDRLPRESRRHRCGLGPRRPRLRHGRLGGRATGRPGGLQPGRPARPDGPAARRQPADLGARRRRGGQPVADPRRRTTSPTAWNGPTRCCSAK